MAKRLIRTSNALEAHRREVASKKKYPMSQYEYWSNAPDKDMDERNAAIRARKIAALDAGVPYKQVKGMGKAFHYKDGSSWFSTDTWTTSDWAWTIVVIVIVIVILLGVGG